MKIKTFNIIYAAGAGLFVAVPFYLGNGFKMGVSIMIVCAIVIYFIDNLETMEPVDDSIKDGFKFCYNYYMENIKDD